MVYYLYHFIALHICHAEIFILDSLWPIFWEKLSLWLSACSVMIVVMLL